jgi:ABC-type antimicrobial peptide transport system permease subunit
VGKFDAFNWESYGPYTYVELSANANINAIDRQLEEFIQGKEPAQHSTTFLFPMSAWRLYNEFENGKQTGGGRVQQVKLLSIVAWIILFIACINFMNLATAGSQQRVREIGVRKVLGAERKGLVIRFIGEALFADCCCNNYISSYYVPGIANV